MLTITVKNLSECQVYSFGKENYGIKKPLSFINDKVNKKTKEITGVTHIQDSNKLWLKTYGLDHLMIETNESNILSITELI